jgi:hypothetical protein
MVAVQLSIEKKVIRQIITSDLNVRKGCAKIMLKNLKKERKLKRKEMCVDIFEKLKEDPDLLSSVVTYDDLVVSVQLRNQMAVNCHQVQRK